MYALAGIPGITITGVTTDTTVSDDATAYRISALERKVHGEWTKVGRRDEIPVRAGSTLALRVVITAGDESTTVPVVVKVPRRMAGESGALEVVGGQDLEGLGPMSTLAQAKAAVAKLVRNDQVQVVLSSVSRRGRTQSVSTRAVGPFDGVVSGQRSVQLLVR